MANKDRVVIEQLVLAERNCLGAAPAPLQPLTIRHTDLPFDSSGGPIAHEWNYYREVVGRLLSEGHEGRWVLIKGKEIIGIWDSEEEADGVRLEKFTLQPVLLKQIQTRERVFRGGGHDRRWLS